MFALSGFLGFVGICLHLDLLRHVFVAGSQFIISFSDDLFQQFYIKKFKELQEKVVRVGEDEGNA